MQPGAPPMLADPNLNPAHLAVLVRIGFNKKAFEPAVAAIKEKYYELFRGKGGEHKEGSSGAAGAASSSAAGAAGAASSILNALFKLSNRSLHSLIFRLSVLLHCAVQLRLAAVLVQLLKLNPACIGKACVMLVLFERAAREVANGVVGSSQPVAPLLSDQLIGVAQAHAEHRLDLVAECGTTASSAPPPASRAWRRCCLLRFGTCSEHTWCGART